MISTAYNFITTITSTLLPFLPISSKKFKQLQNGQKATWQTLTTAPKNAVWVHVASAGEFEQAKALIELLHNSGEKIVVSFFSPSGYEAQKNNPILSTVLYLPIDSPQNSKQFIEMLQPKACILVKYDFWLNFMKQLSKKNIPIFLISGVFYNDQFLFKWFGREHLQQIRNFKYISVQDENSKNVLALQNISCDVTGDTRIDRSLQLPTEVFENDIIKNFTEDSTLSIALGSVWQPDLDIWRERLSILNKKNIKLIIAPHELGSNFLEQIKEEFDAQFLSTYDKRSNSNVLIIDKIGVLKHLYRYADIAYIGGGFGKGIHNTLEPASYGIPVIFGPKHTHFMEAVEMVKNEGAFNINNVSELHETLAYLMVEENRRKAGNNALAYLQKYKGASKKAFNTIQAYL